LISKFPQGFWDHATPAVAHFAFLRKVSSFDSHSFFFGALRSRSLNLEGLVNKPNAMQIIDFHKSL
jgi:hypothetical protein